jgi:cytoskeletal protein CcmA (bactofilin family)
MFTKSKEADTAAVATTSAKRSGRASAPSIISADLTVVGMLISAGDVQVDGRIEGDVRAKGLVIGDEANIQGDVYAEDAVIRGRVEGGIRANKVQLCATSHVEGAILHEALAVEAGAFFEGNCRHSDNPLGDGPGDIPKIRLPEKTAQPNSPQSGAQAGNTAKTRNGASAESKENSAASASFETIDR